MTCPICDRLYCDHSPAERGETLDEMLADMAMDSSVASAEELQTRNALQADFLERLRQHHVGMYQHSLRVGGYVRFVAEDLGRYAPLTLSDVEAMGNLHDIGKLALRAELFDQQSLTTAEYLEIQQHTRAGYSLLVDSLPIAACAAGKHHPSYAVAAYPASLSRGQRKAIDRCVPLVTLCDFYDALLTRDNSRYAHVNKKDPRQVRSVLDRTFPDQQKALDILFAHFGQQILSFDGVYLISSDPVLTYR